MKLLRGDRGLAWWRYRLVAGHCEDVSRGACALAAIAWLTAGEHTDDPACVSPALRAFVIPANDAMDDDTRQRFLPFLHRLAGSVDPLAEGRRVRIIVLGALRIFVPLALERCGLSDIAASLRSLPDDVDWGRAVDAAVDAERVVRLMYMVFVEGAASTVRAAKAAFHAAAMEVSHAALAAREAGAWDDYFRVLDAALSAGRQGEPWSADVADAAAAAYAKAGGLCVSA